MIRGTNWSLILLDIHVDNTMNFSKAGPNHFYFGVI